ncbi:MAG: STT3 domain-containing protein [Pyrobaculum sp.]
MGKREKLLLVIPALLAIFAIALYVRIYRVFLWGWWLDEFDPYIRYYLAKYTLEHGVGWWWEGAYFTQFWHPYGVNWGAVLLPGTSLYGLFLYFLLAPFGVDLWRAVIVAPAVMGALAVFSMFYLGYRLGAELGIPHGGIRVGLTAALLTAIAPAFVERGLAAWFDDEPISLFLIPLGLALLIDGLKRPWVGALAGAVLGFVAWTWGAHFYIWNLVGLYALVLPTYYFLKYAYTNPQRVVKGKKAGVTTTTQLSLPFTSWNLFASYAAFYIVYAVFVATIPRYGVAQLLSPFNILPTIGLLMTALVWLLDTKIGITKTTQLLRKYIWIILGVAAAGVALLIFAIAAGLIGGKFLATLLPFGRSAIVASVAEHSTTTFTQILSRYGALLPFIVASVPYLFNPPGLLALTYLATGGYAAATMVRLLVLLAPIAIAAAAVGIVRLIENRRLGFLILVSAALSIVILINSVMPVLSPQNPSQTTGLARQPTQIIVSAVGVVSDDFIDALMWLKTRLPPYEPVASWWDYGYWISVIGNKTSLADNSTINATQIGKIGLGFMAPPEVGAKIFKEELKARYLLAIMPFVIYPLPQLGTVILIHEYPPGGDFLKSYWMTRIALEDVPGADVILGAVGMSPEDYIYTKVMSYPGPPPSPNYAYYTIGTTPYPVPLSLNRTLYTMLFSKVRLLPIYGNLTQDMPWVFEGVVQLNQFTSFRRLGFTGGNVVLPIDEAPRGIIYRLSGWTTDGVEIVKDPLTGTKEYVAYITAMPRHLRPVYVSKPLGIVVIYEITS